MLQNFSNTATRTAVKQIALLLNDIHSGRLNKHRRERERENEGEGGRQRKRGGRRDRRIDSQTYRYKTNQTETETNTHTPTKEKQIENKIKKEKNTKPAQRKRGSPQQNRSNARLPLQALVKARRLDPAWQLG